MMDAPTQQAAAEAMAATGYHWYRPDSDGSGNVKRLERVPWPTALVLIQRGQSKGWILAREPEPRRHLALVEDEGVELAEWAEAGSRRPDEPTTVGR